MRFNRIWLYERHETDTSQSVQTDGAEAHWGVKPKASTDSALPKVIVSTTWSHMKISRHGDFPDFKSRLHPKRCLATQAKFYATIIHMARKHLLDAGLTFVYGARGLKNIYIYFILCKVGWKFIYQIQNAMFKNTYFPEMLEKKTHPVFFCQFPFFNWQTELFIVIARSYFEQYTTKLEYFPMSVLKERQAVNNIYEYNINTQNAQKH